MNRPPSLGLSRRLLILSVVFGLFVLFDIALFGWLIFRSLSQREIENVLLETRNEAEKLARQIARRAEHQGKDLFTAVASGRETQTYIDSVLRQREIVRMVEIRDKDGTLVYTATVNQRVETPQERPPVSSPEIPREVMVRDIELPPLEIPNIEVPIGDLGRLQIIISAPELAQRIEVLRGELIRQTTVVGAVSILLLLSAYVGIWLLLRRARRLELQTAEAERLAYIGTLASGLAHEIRNPLNSLNLNMQMLEEEVDERGTAPTSKRLLSITRSEISRLERLVSDFLAYAKPRPLEMEEVPAVLLVESIPEVLAGEIQKRRARVKVEDRSGGAHVRVDLAQMKQLLLNLAQNSLAATEESGRPPVLELGVRREGPWVLIDVVDNGIGIPAEEQDKIFDLFYSTRKGGTGLGLAIVDRIARAHDGRVTVASAPGTGTVMTLELPAVTTPEATPRPALETVSS